VKNVAIVRDLLYQPSEATVFLRIKSLIVDGDAAGAEQLLASLSNERGDAVKRLRTFAPILQHYCEIGDLPSALRVYREMEQSPGAHLNSETYALLLSTLAKRGWFTTDQNTTSPDSFPVSSGPALLDALVSEMATDILEIDESSAETIVQGFTSRLEDPTRIQNGRRVFVGRVSVDNDTAICPETGAQLQLFVLSDEQKNNVRNTLVEMAESQYDNYTEKLLVRRHGKSHGKVDRKAAKKANNMMSSGQYALSELTNFLSWLRLRKGEPFSAFIDGPNVAYYGTAGVQWSQVELVVKTLETMGENPLVIMPQKYLAAKIWLSIAGHTQALTESDQAIIDRLLDSKQMYVVPSACLDDYYWMIGSVAEQNGNKSLHVTSKDVGVDFRRLTGLRPILVTNDKMRDHRLALLEPRLFRRWTSCHIVNYHIQSSDTDERDEKNVTLFPADYFSREIQCNPASRLPGNSTAWHFPVLEWPEPDRLCVSIIN
jgi:hypothetical protein